MIRPTLDEAKIIAESKQCRVMPLGTEIYSDEFTPVQVMRTLKTLSGHCFMLESAEDKKTWGRYTFLGYDPKKEIT
ncbi:MAG TPA: anthranilate synthase component I, partial [Ruminococcaceae bacterium]|nr:anthranilate synthase component I [Oscillospiraceae bacterium]